MSKPAIDKMSDSTGDREDDIDRFIKQRASEFNPPWSVTFDSQDSVQGDDKFPNAKSSSLIAVRPASPQ